MQICHISLSPKERLLILENVLLILTLIIKSLSTRTTKFFFSIRSIGLNMHWLGGFGKDTASWALPNYSKINVCLTLNLMCLKARLLVSCHTVETLWISCHGQTIFFITISLLEIAIHFLWSFLLFHTASAFFLCSVFFGIRKFPDLCSFQGQCTFQLFALFTWKVNKIT